jgi:hypothetical protein
MKKILKIIILTYTFINTLVYVVNYLRKPKYKYLPRKENIVKKENILEKLKKRKIEIDNSYNTYILFGKIKDSNKVIQIYNSVIPKNIKTTYQIIKNSENIIVKIKENYYKKGIKNKLSTITYFNNNGSTFAYEMIIQMKYKNDNKVLDIYTDFFNNSFYNIKSEHKVINKDGKLFNKDIIEEIDIKNMQIIVYNFRPVDNLLKYLKFNNLNLYINNK